MRGSIWERIAPRLGHAIASQKVRYSISSRPQSEKASYMLMNIFAFSELGKSRSGATQPSLFISFHAKYDSCPHRHQARLLTFSRQRVRRENLSHPHPYIVSFDSCQLNPISCINAGFITDSAGEHNCHNHPHSERRVARRGSFHTRSAKNP